MVKSGIIDPTKVVRAALQNAASVGALLITTQAMTPRERRIDFSIFIRLFCYLTIPGSVGASRKSQITYWKQTTVRVPVA